MANGLANGLANGDLPVAFCILAPARFREPIVRLSRPALSGLLAAVLLASLAPQRASAQRRPGVGMGFYTYTGLVAGDVELGQVTGTTAYAEGPTVTLSGVVSAPLLKLRKKALIVALRGTAISYGNSDGCLIVPPSADCQQRRFTERFTVLTGMAWDIRESLLRVTAGPALYSVERDGARFGTQVRVDYARPRQGSRMPTLFLSRSFLGSQKGRGVGFTTIGLGIRTAKKQ